MIGAGPCQKGAQVRRDRAVAASGRGGQRVGEVHRIGAGTAVGVLLGLLACIAAAIAASF